MPERRSFKDFFAEAVSIFRKNISVFLLLTLFVFIPIALANVYIVDRIIDTELLNDYLTNFESYLNTTDYEKIANLSALTKQFSTYLFVSFILSLFSLVGDIVVIKTTYERLNGKNRPFFEIFEDSVKQYPKVLGIFLLTRFFISLGIFLIIPSLYMIFLFGFVIQVVVIYNIGGFRALRHAVRVSRIDLMRVVGYKLFPVLLLIPLTSVTSILFDFISNKFVVDAINVIKLSVDSLIMCIGTILVTLLFFDLQKYVGEPVDMLSAENYSSGQS
ncbi:MAG: hypothetical protein GX166_04005 [Clostridiaceae bacterium]|nr:hypothetical protein [Clostridiaceae bacterium]